MKDLLWKVPCVALMPLLYVVPIWHAGYWPLAYVSLVPWLIAIVHRPGRTELLLSFPAWWACGILVVNWLSTFGKIALVIAPFFYVIPFFFLGWAIRRVRQACHLPLCVVLPVLFTAAEWLRIAMSPGRLTLGMAGYSQVKLTKLIQIVDVTGIWGLGFLLMAWNGWFADQLLFWLERRGGWHRWWRKAALSGGILAGVAAGLFLYGIVRDTEEKYRDGPTIAIVQPNVPHYATTKQALNRRTYDLQVVYTLSKIPRGSADLVLWPENALLDWLEKDGESHRRYTDDFPFLTSSIGAPMLVDAGEVSDGKGYHTVYHVSREGKIVGKSRKVYLLPWTEYVPFADALDWVFLGNSFRRLLRKTVGQLTEGTPGRLEDIRLFEVEWSGGKTAFGVPICFESATPAATRKMARDGAEFLVNPSSEGALGKSVYRQTLIINAFRAVEGRTAVIRATNTGISGIIDSNGRIRNVLRGEETGSLHDEAGILIDRVPLDSRAGKTLYVHFGDWFAYLSLLLAGLWIVASEVRLVLFPPGRLRRPEEPGVPAEWFGLGPGKKGKTGEKGSG